MDPSPVGTIRRSLRLRLLGPAEITVDGRLLTAQHWSGRRARSLLLLLAGTPGHRLHREQIIDLLWPDADLGGGANALYKALHALRRTLEPGLRTGRESTCVTVSGDTIALGEAIDLWLDVDQFSNLLSHASSLPAGQQRPILRNALDLYRGEFVADERYDEWPVPRREALRADHERTVLDLAALDLQAGEPLAAIPWLEALLAQEPTAETAHRALMRAYQAAGQRSLALRQYERCRDLLDREFGDTPEPETIHLAQAIRQAPAPVEDDAVIRAASAKYRSLPAVPTRTIGRDDEIADVATMLRDPAIRLVTITGTGGIGKTRLATEVATSLKADYPDGIVFVPLASLRNADLLFPAIGAALRIPEDARHPIRELVIDSLQGRSALLVLDNLEHLPELGREIADLLADCTTLSMLATSRVPLSIRAEHLYKLNLLETPLAGTTSEADLAAIGASALFLQCLRALHHNPRLSPAELSAVSEICIRLDGLPLAIELAAARCLDLTPRAMLEQLNQRARIMVLKHGPQDLPDRHQTLPDLVRWSYDLLSTPEQALFRRLAVFIGGGELDALEAIGGENALAIANSLEAKSLINWSHVDGTRRLTMLETIREVAAFLLADADEEDAVWMTTTGFYTLLSKRAYVELRGPHQLTWYDRLLRDLNTIRATLDWSLAHAPDDALAIAGHLQMFWFYRHSTLEGLGWIEQALAATPDVLTHNRMVATIGASQCLERTGDYSRARHLADQAAELAKSLQDPEGYASALRQQAASAFRREDIAGGMKILAEAIEISRDHSDPHGIGHCLVGQALIQKARGDYSGAILSLEQALETSRQANHHMLQSYILMHLTNTLYQSDNLTRAAEVAQECERASRIADSRLSLPWALLLQTLIAHDESRYSEGLALALEASALFAEVGDRRGAAASLIQCGMLEIKLGALTNAAQRFLLAIPDVRRVGYESDKYDFLMETALLAHATGQLQQAYTLLAANDACRLASGVSRSPGDAMRFEVELDAVRSQLDDLTTERNWTIGQTMDLDDALDLAVTCCNAVIADREAQPGYEDSIEEVA